MKKKPIIINNENNKPETLSGLIEFINSKRPLACYFNSDSFYCNLDECSLIKGNLYHINNKIANPFYGFCITEENIRKYNENCKDCNDMIKCVYFPNGTILYP